MSAMRYNKDGAILWDCPCGFHAGANPEWYFKHQDSGSCVYWPGYKVKKLQRNLNGGLKAPKLGGFTG